MLSNLQKRPVFDTFEVKNDLRPLAKSADQKFRENDHFGRFRPFLATLEHDQVSYSEILVHIIV